MEAFRQRLLKLDPRDRERWVDGLLGIDDLFDDEDLPPGCVPYLPCSVDVIVRAVDRAKVTASDVFVDVGSGLGRALVLVHWLTGAAAVGLEIQGRLARQAQVIADRLRLDRVRTIHGDAEHLLQTMSQGTVFFFYCPFGEARLTRALAALRPLALVRPLRLCFVDTPVPPLPWLARDPASRDDDPIVVCETLTRFA